MVSFLNPEKFIDKLNLQNDFIAAEFGCGPGGFALVLAKKLDKGVVYGLDIQEEPISALWGRAKNQGLSNIKTIKCNLEEPQGSTLQDNFLDLVVVSNVLFQTEEKEAMLKEAKRILKPKGKLLAVEWRPEAPFGPQEGRTSFEEIQKIMRLLEMELVEKIPAGTYHWAALFEKP